MYIIQVTSMYIFIGCCPWSIRGQIGTDYVTNVVWLYMYFLNEWCSYRWRLTASFFIVLTALVCRSSTLRGAQNMQYLVWYEFEKQVQTLESVHPLISKYRQAGEKKLGCASYFQPACLYFEIRGRTLTRVWTITSKTVVDFSTFRTTFPTTSHG